MMAGVVGSFCGTLHGESLWTQTGNEAANVSYEEASQTGSFPLLKSHFSNIKTTLLHVPVLVATLVTACKPVCM